MSMTLRIEIFPNDLGPTVDFYTGVLDFDLVRDESAAEAAYVAFERGEVKLGAAARPDHRPDRDHRRPPTGVELVLEVDDVEAELDRVCGRKPAESYPDQEYVVRRCLKVVLKEEAEHHRYAVRDLAALEAGPSGTA